MSFNGILAIDKDKVNVLVEPAEDVAVVVDHYQFLQVRTQKNMLGCSKLLTFVTYIIVFSVLRYILSLNHIPSKVE